MRRCYLICYDISDPKRLRAIHKKIKGYGEAWQFSVYFCVLKDIDRVRLQTDLEAILNRAQDQILIIDLGSHEGGARSAATILGKNLPEQNSGMVVI